MNSNESRAVFATTAERMSSYRECNFGTCTKVCTTESVAPLHGCNLYIDGIADSKFAVYVYISPLP